MSAKRGMKAHGKGLSRLTLAGLVLVPASIGLRALAFRHPGKVEDLYGNVFYPIVARGLGGISSVASFSLAELLLLLLLAALPVYLWRSFKSGTSKTRWVGRECLRWLAAGGAVFFMFLALWGLNYARPGIENRLSLRTERVSTNEILDGARRAALRASSLHSELGARPGTPTHLPISFESLDDAVDASLAHLDLPGLPAHRPPSRAKRLFTSTALAYAGVSGIFIPFTSEPSVNDLLPDSILPLVVAHEKAHQLGVANEGEASLVAFMACARAKETKYLPYTAYLEAASELLGAVARDRPREAREVLDSLGPGPLTDLRAVRDFWARYEGPFSRGAHRVNDAYLKSFRVPGGVQSYARLPTLLVALDRAGRFDAP